MRAVSGRGGWGRARGAGRGCMHVDKGWDLSRTGVALIRAEPAPRSRDTLPANNRQLAVYSWIWDVPTLSSHSHPTPLHSTHLIKHEYSKRGEMKQVHSLTAASGPVPHCRISITLTKIVAAKEARCFISHYNRILNFYRIIIVMTTCDRWWDSWSLWLSQ